MRYVLIALAAAALAAPAFALNPQPLPPGRAAATGAAMGPVDPCRGMTGNSRIRCVQRHFKLPPPHRIGSSSSGGGTGK
jgi:hypothetical protein